MFFIFCSNLLLESRREVVVDVDVDISEELVTTIFQGFPAAAYYSFAKTFFYPTQSPFRAVVVAHLAEWLLSEHHRTLGGGLNPVTGHYYLAFRN